MVICLHRRYTCEKILTLVKESIRRIQLVTAAGEISKWEQVREWDICLTDNDRRYSSKESEEKIWHVDQRIKELAAQVTLTSLFKFVGKGLTYLFQLKLVSAENSRKQVSNINNEPTEKRVELSKNCPGGNKVSEQESTASWGILRSYFSWPTATGEPALRSSSGALFFLSQKIQYDKEVSRAGELSKDIEDLTRVLLWWQHLVLLTKM